MARGHVVPPLAGNAVGSVAPRTSEASQSMALGYPVALRSQIAFPEP